MRPDVVVLDLSPPNVDGSVVGARGRVVTLVVLIDGARHRR
jgi:chemotaxis response regulator CheB